MHAVNNSSNIPPMFDLADLKLQNEGNHQPYNMQMVSETY